MSIFQVKICWLQGYAAAACAGSKGSMHSNLLALMGMVDVGVSCSFCNVDDRPREDFYYNTVHEFIINEFFKYCTSFFLLF